MSQLNPGPLQVLTFPLVVSEVTPNYGKVFNPVPVSTSNLIFPAPVKSNLISEAYLAGSNGLKGSIIHE